MGFFPCSNIFCITPNEVDLVYFIILLITNTLNWLIGLANMWIVLKHLWVRPQPQRWPTERRSVAVVVPCYLPNEQAVIMATVEHMATQLQYDGPLTIWIVYNTPHHLGAAQEALDSLDRREYEPGRSLRILEVQGSRSKAENLDRALQLIEDEFVVLYDADHRPERASLARMMREMEERECCAVQGSTYIRNTRGSWLARLVNAEFFVTHFVYFPAMEQLAGTGYFGGSNALWRTSELRRYGFDKKMHTEDVDLSARLILDNRRVHFYPRARSGELCPADGRALVTQRLRWFVGWEQVTHKYYWRVLFSPLSIRQKLGFMYMFHLRWLLLLAALMGAVINPVITSPFVYPLPTWSTHIQWTVYITVGLYLFVASFGVCAVVRNEPRKPLNWLWVVLFFVCSWVYVTVHFTLQTIAFVKVMSGRAGNWVVTARSDDVSDSPLSRHASVHDGALKQVVLHGANGVNGAGTRSRERASMCGGSAALAPLAEPLLRS